VEGLEEAPGQKRGVVPSDDWKSRTYVRYPVSEAPREERARMALRADGFHCLSSDDTIDDDDDDDYDDDDDDDVDENENENDLDAVTDLAASSFSLSSFCGESCRWELVTRRFL